MYLTGVPSPKKERRLAHKTLSIINVVLLNKLFEGDKK
jgi:hypothetical protein